VVVVARGVRTVARKVAIELVVEELNGAGEGLPGALFTIGVGGVRFVAVKSGVCVGRIGVLDSVRHWFAGVRDDVDLREHPASIVLNEHASLAGTLDEPVAVAVNHVALVDDGGVLALSRWVGAINGCPERPDREVVAHRDSLRESSLE